jgi:hypothetical protein
MPESFTDTPLLTERFDDALRYATAHHARQLRKGTALAEERQGPDTRVTFDWG